MKPIHKVIPAKMVSEFKEGTAIKALSKRWHVTTADVIKTLRECMGEGQYQLFARVHSAIAKKGKRQSE